MHEHKIIEIMKHEHIGNTSAYWIRMDCPVQPEKVLVCYEELSVGMYFDPDFTNKFVLARFQPAADGWHNALIFALHN